MDKLFIAIIALTALIAGYVVYDTSREVGVEIDRQSQTAGAIWNTPTSTLQAKNVQKVQVRAEDATEGNILQQRVNGNYILSEVNGKKISEGQNFTLLITNSKISGRICNSFSGEYSTSKDVLIAGPLATTKMACVGETGDYENIFFTLINAKPRFKQSGDSMILTAQNNVLIFKHIYE